MPIKYTQEDIERIYNERVTTIYSSAEYKKGTIAEFKFTYPNGNTTADVVGAYCVDESLADANIGHKVCEDKIKDKLWQICGQYSLITNEKL